MNSVDREAFLRIIEANEDDETALKSMPTGWTIVVSMRRLIDSESGVPQRTG